MPSAASSLNAETATGPFTSFGSTQESNAPLEASRATRLVRAPGRWTSCGRKFIGAITDVALVRPVHVDADLPVVSFGKEKRGRAYAEGTVHLTADDVTELHIGVDLNRGRVVSIDLGGDSVHTSGYSVVEPLTPAGAPDKATCPQGD